VDKQEIRDTVNQLVEAWHDQDEAREQLDNYRVSHSPPKPPSQFEGLRDLFEFDELKRSYQGALTNYQNQLEAAQKAYAEAGEKLREVLPENVGLAYTYQGKRGYLDGERYLIVNTEGGVIVRWHTHPEIPPP
jgi:hypothetical protein